jgi:hypothetical protein
MFWNVWKTVGHPGTVCGRPRAEQESHYPEFKQAILKYQRGKGLVESGRIDYGTLSAASELPVSRYLFNPPLVEP